MDGPVADQQISKEVPHLWEELAQPGHHSAFEPTSLIRQQPSFPIPHLH